MPVPRIGISLSIAVSDFESPNNSPALAACGFVSFDHPFLDPDSDVFAYEGGYITVRQRLSARDLISGVTSALARIMQRLGEDPYFGNVCHQTMHRVRVLANRRKLQFQTFGLGLELQKITGI